MARRSQEKRLAFTLVEMLFVISMIGLLSVMILAAVNTARVKARDAKRISDFGEIQKALALYYDAYGYYPARSGTYVNGCETSKGNGSVGSCFEPCWSRCVDTKWSTNSGNLYDALVIQGKYLSTLPIDPSNGSGKNLYYYKSFLPGEILPIVGGSCVGQAGKSCFYILTTNLEKFLAPCWNSGWGVNPTYDFNYCVIPVR
jgi:type II secretory pathway pseudopilin PulG